MYAAGGLEVDEDDDRVRCHLCGGWWRGLNAHARLSHGLNADKYRALTGLLPRQPLEAPTVTAGRANRLRAQIVTDPRIREGMSRGAELARTGALQARARDVAETRGPRLARAEQLRSGGRALGRSRARAFRDKREARATELGYATLAAYLQTRYVVAGATIDELCDELGASYSAVRAELRRAGVNVRRGSAPRPRNAD